MTAPDSPSGNHVPARALPPEQSWDTGHSTPRRRATEGRTFGRSLGWPVVGLLWPGAGLLASKYRFLGAIMVGVTALVATLAVGLAVFARGAFLSLAVQPGFLTAVWVAVVVVGIAWAFTLAITHLSHRPFNPPAWQRIVGSVWVGILSMVLLVPSFFAAGKIYETASFVKDVFSGQQAAPIPRGNFGDPWAGQARVNVLILGGDSGNNRDETLGARTDTVIVASIDTSTGNTVLLSLPRQTQRVPFPEGSPMAEKWPNGFTDGTPNNAEYFLNAIYNNVPAALGEGALGDVKNPGAEVLKQAVGTALGLDIQYYVLVNMDGFKEFIDALGGVTVNVNKPVPMGGKNHGLPGDTPPSRWLAPGPNQHLNGQDALWYARGRYGTADYERMQRQRCVIQAVANQAKPEVVLANYEALTRAGRNIIETDVPAASLPAFSELALRVKGRPMRSVSFENGQLGFSTVRPDWDLVRQRVQEALNPVATPSPSESASSTPSATPTPKSTKSTKATPSATPTPTPSPVQNTEDECGYNPVPYDPNNDVG